MSQTGQDPLFDEARFDEVCFDGAPRPARKGMKTKVKIGWKDLTEQDKMKLALKIKEKSAGNADAAKIAALLLKLDGGITTAQAAIGAEEVAAQNVKQCTLTKGKALDALGGVVSRIGSFAEDEFPDAPEKAVGLGLDLRAENSPIGPLPAPAGMSVTGGDHPGTLEGACYPVPGRDIYEGEIATHPDGPYTRVYVGKVSSFIAPDLVSGTEYWLRMRAHGTAGFGPWSNRGSGRAT